jgi:hypothetical protein
MDRLADDEGGHLFRQLTGVLDGDVDQDDDSESDSSYNPGDESGTEVDDEYEADEDDETGSNNSFGENQHDDVGDALYEGIKGLHAVVVHDSIHCPPLVDLPMELNRECNCIDFGIYTCILLEWVSDDHPLDFPSIHEGALGSVDSEVRRPNNINRKALYRKLFFNLAFNDHGEGGRRELPNCAVAIVRQIYPNANGNYMGFLEG